MVDLYDVDNTELIGFKHPIGHLFINDCPLINVAILEQKVRYSNLHNR